MIGYWVSSQSTSCLFSSHPCPLFLSFPHPLLFSKQKITEEIIEEITEEIYLILGPDQTILPSFH